MRKDILLCFLSMVHTSGEHISTTVYENIGAEKECHATNESAVRYLLQGEDALPNGLSKLFLVQTKKVAGNITCRVGNQKPANFIDSDGRTWTHYDYFMHRIGDIVPNASDIAETIPFDERASVEVSMDTLIDVAFRVRHYAREVRTDDPDATIVLHVDCTGGMRNATMILLALMRLVEYERISLGKVLYSNYEEHRVEEVNPLYSFFDLVAGAEEFVRHGEVSVMSDYFQGRATSPALRNLLRAMRRFAKELKLCRYGELREAIERLHQTIEVFSTHPPTDEERTRIPAEEQSDQLMRQMLGRIKEDYDEILTQQHDDLVLIRWCIQHDLLQQAMTLFTERIPEILVKSHFVQIRQEYREDFESAHADDNLGRSAAFFLVNEYRKPGSVENEALQTKKESTTLERVRKQWKEDFSNFIRGLRTCQEEEVHRFVDNALTEHPAFRLRTPERLRDALLWMWRMIHPHTDQHLRNTQEGQRFLANVRPLFVKSRLPGGGVPADADLAEMQRGIWEKLLAEKDGILVSKLMKLLSTGGVNIEEQNQVYLGVEWKPGIRRLYEGGFTVRDEALAQRIFMYYADIKGERNHTSHARAELGRITVEELKQLMERALMEVEKAALLGAESDE